MEIAGTSRPAMLATGLPVPTHWQLFCGFFAIAINGFGGVMPFARRMLVEKRNWLTPEEFVDALAMCQFVPGPNIVNFAVAFGGRLRGISGALACVAGILISPIVIGIATYKLLLEFAEAPAVLGALRGMSAVAAGLVTALGVKLIAPVLRRKDWLAFGCALVTAAVIGILRLPLLPVLAVVVPSAIYLQWRRR